MVVNLAWWLFVPLCECIFLISAIFYCVSTLVIYNIYCMNIIIKQIYQTSPFCLWQIFYIHSIWAAECRHRYMWDISIWKYNPKISFHRHLLRFEFACFHQTDLTWRQFSSTLFFILSINTYYSYSTYYALLACEQHLKAYTIEKNIRWMYGEQWNKLVHRAIYAWMFYLYVTSMSCMLYI